MNREHFHKIYFYTALLILAGLGYVVAEIWHLKSQPDEAEIKKLATESVEKAASAFQDYVQNFEERSLITFGAIQSQIINNELSEEDIYELISNEPSFWGASLFKNDSLIVWSGYTEQLNGPPPFVPKKFTLYVLRDRNVNYLKGINAFTTADSTEYSFVTTTKLKQRNTLDFGSNTELTTSEILDIDLPYPVHFKYFSTVPDDIIYKKTVAVHANLEATTVYATHSDQLFFEQNRERLYTKVKMFLLLVFFGVGGMLMINLSNRFDSRRSFLMLLISLILGWSLLWLLLPTLKLELILGVNSSLRELIHLGLNAFLAFLFAVLISEFYYSNRNFKVKVGIKASTIISPLFGLVIASVTTAISVSLYGYIVDTNLHITDLNLVPSFSVYLLYAFSGMLWISASWSIVYLVVILFKTVSTRGLSTLFFIIFGFILGMYLVGLTRLQDNIDWLIYTSSSIFIVLISISYLSWRNTLHLQYKSKLRLILFICFVATVISYVPFYNGQIERRNSVMENQAKSFTHNSESQIENITIEILIRLEKQLSALEVTDLEEQSDQLISEFNDEVTSLIESRQEWQSYSFSVQLIDTKGDPLAEFTTNLNAPGWTKTFDMFSLEIPYEQERIRRDRLRPIIRENPLERPSSSYTTYRQGWVPVFESPTSERKIAWVITSVYQEQPQYRKPLRAVVASKKEQEKNSSFLISEYENGELKRSSTNGLPIEIPSLTVLPDEILEQVEQDSVFYRNTTLGGQDIKEYYWKIDDENVIRVATFNTTLANHAFGLLRFFFYLLATLFLVTLILQWQKDILIIGSNIRFKDRLIDRFVIASMLCLIALIATSSGTIIKQSAEIVVDDLNNKLVSVANTYENSSNEDVTETLLLSSNLLNSDAVLFKGSELIGSTAPQIFSQHILPSQVPWDVFNAIINNGSDVEIRSYKLGDQDLLIGFKPIISNGEVSNIAAIPTFLKTPSFNEQLLSTTSYLVGMFFIIFGVFILGAAYIANQMTTPLEELNEGIKTISEGSLETTLPVKSKDEIGSLTNAFNVMVYRLQDLRKNLVEVEREAAWKEMAQQVAHEIKNPLTPMKLSLQHLERQINNPNISDEKIKAQFSKVNQNLIEQIESLSKIASDFSKFAKPIEQPLERMDINEVLSAVSDMYTHEERIHLNVDLHSEPIFIQGVKDELRRVFINLIKNAIEAIPKKGEVSINSLKAGDRVIVQISDTGEGITEENQSSIFVPNFSTKSSGTGLGLAISKKIIEAHNGEIRFVSMPGEGTTFEVIFKITN